MKYGEWKRQCSSNLGHKGVVLCNACADRHDAAEKNGKASGKCIFCFPSEKQLEKDMVQAHIRQIVYDHMPSCLLQSTETAAGNE